MPAPLRTYGEKPIVFKFGEGEDAEEWMIGSEVSTDTVCILVWFIRDAGKF